MTPTGYVQHLRIGKARELLQFTKRPVEQIAYAVGYDNSGAFRRLFGRVVGLSPGEYRRKFTTPTSAAVGATEGMSLHRSEGIPRPSGRIGERVV